MFDTQTLDIDYRHLGLDLQFGKVTKDAAISERVVEQRAEKMRVKNDAMHFAQVRRLDDLCKMPQ